MHLDHFDLKHQADLTEYLLSKRKRLAGTFKHSYTNESLRQTLMRTSVLSGVDRATTNGSTMTVNTMAEPSYNTFLTDKDELPRLSILNNYNNIMRIMTKNYIRGKIPCFKNQETAELEFTDFR